MRRLVWLCLLLAGCNSWSTTRLELVTPLHDLLHGRYARALEKMDESAIVALHDPGCQPEAAVRTRKLLAKFAAVDHASCVIERAELSAGVVRVTLMIRLDGRTAGDRRITLEQRQQLACRQQQGDWRIISAEPGTTRQQEASGPWFNSEAAERGLVATHRSRGVTDREGIAQAYLAGSGLSVRDIDGDGLEELLLVNGGALRLFYNLGGRFVEQSRERGLRAPAKGECRYALFGDLDNDGDPDLFIGVLNGPNLLLRNDGRGYFETMEASRAGIPALQESTGACLLDYDRDGDLDLYIVNGANLLRTQPEPIYNAKNATANQLLRNRGDGTFEDVTETAGVGDTGWGLACSASDYDNDGHSDLFVGNDFGPDVLYRNRGDGTFENATIAAGLTYHGSSMGVSFGDVNGDGELDLFVSAMASNSRWMIDMPGFPAPAPFPLNIFLRSWVLDLFKEMLHGNRLYINRGDGTFREVSEATGTRNAGWAWGGLFLDYDNDGRQDIYVLNGCLTGKNPVDC